MGIPHTVAEGEGLSSLAEQYGFSPDRIWNDPANAELKRIRPDPEILSENDVVTIPDKETKSVSCPTGARHRFRRAGIPALFSLRLLGPDGPRANEAYVIEYGSHRIEAVTDANGVLRHYLPPSTRQIILTIDGARTEIDVGGMEPLDGLAGAQMRLNNLGFLCGEAGGVFDVDTADALRRFQAKYGLEVTGALDDATRDALLQAHDVQDGQPEPR